MTSTPLTCDGFANALADYLERDDSPRVRAAVETHAASCGECGALLADLQQLRIDASGLPTLSPSRDLWAGIAGRIATPVVEIGARAPTGVRGGSRPSRVVSWLRPMAAAAALVAITAGVTYVATREAVLRQLAIRSADTTVGDPIATVASANDSARRVQAVATQPAMDRAEDVPAARRSGERAPDRAPAAVRSRGTPVRAEPAGTPVSLASDRGPAAAVDSVYDREITRLRRIVDERRTMLDPGTVGVLERNLMIIDRAILDSRAALARDPASALLNDQLNNALEQKVELLRTAALLLPVRS